jgi:serine/threonine protein kinase
MAPEQAAGGTIDERTDLYAVGVLLYEMLASHPPFQADAPGILLRMQMISDPPPLPDWVPEVVRAVVAKLLAKPAKERFESARQARAALEQAVAPQTRAPRGGVMFLPAISDAEPEPAVPERPRRHTQRGSPSLADDQPPPSSTSMSGRSATMFAEHSPAAPPVDPAPMDDSQALTSGVFGTVRAMPSVREPERPSGARGRTVAIVVVVVAVLALVMLAASGALDG